MGKIREFEQLDYETGEVIKRYRTVKEALEEHGIDRAKMRLAFMGHDGKFPDKKLWFRYGDGVNKPLQRYQVGKLNDAGEVVKVYNSAEQATIEHYVTEKTIGIAIRTRNGFVPSLGMRFKYMLG